jgi:hypothetical protein
MDPPWCVTLEAFPRGRAHKRCEHRAYGEGVLAMPELTYIASMMMAVLAVLIGRSDD